MLRKTASFSFLLFVLLVTGCTRPADAPKADRRAGCIESFDASKDYFDDKATLQYAQNFAVEYHNSYKVVTVHSSENRAPEQYVLLRCGAPKPALAGDLADAPVIPVPIASMFSDSATHMPLIVELGHVEVVTGINVAKYITTEPVLQRVRQGLVLEYAPNYVIDAERVISKAPSILMAGGGYPDAYRIIRKAGIPVVKNTEWEEASALGRAEWIKYMGLFLNEEGKAERAFNEIRDRYMKLVESTQQIPQKDRPRVMSGVLARGKFEVSGGQSYVAKLIADAGGAYVWGDNKSTGVVTVDLEAQLSRAASADFWINGGEWKSLKSMASDEPRYKEFNAFRRGNVWLYNRIVTETGAYDYWSRGTTRPDLILEDLIKIFHPELAMSHEFVWYKQVPAE